MAGLFGGGGQDVVYVPQQPQETTTKKGATDLEKLKGQTERRKAYGEAIQFRPDNLLSGDTTLSSGSLLSLGGTLG